MSNLGQLLQYLQHLNTAIKHPTDREDLSRLWNARERVRQAIDGITRPRGLVCTRFDRTGSWLR